MEAALNRIQTTFRQLRRTGRAALMPYLTMGYPQRDSALSLVPVIAEAGADLIELGIPFSDPLADGPTIQAASQRALENGMSLKLGLAQAAALRAEGTKLPFVLMSYFNPILQFGIEHIARDASAAGIDGIIIPDLPPEEADTVQPLFRAVNLDLIFLVAPTSDAARVWIVTHRSDGFIYLVSLVGVTGMRDRLTTDLTSFVNRVRTATSKPLAIGFGISTPEQAGQVACLADGVIVGSALVKAVGEATDPVAAARSLVSALRNGMDCHGSTNADRGTPLGAFEVGGQ